MIIRRILDLFRSQDWTALVLELIIVISGIFMAFQLERWWSNQLKVVKAKEYVIRLNEDLARDTISINYAINLARLRLRFTDLLLDVVQDPENVNKRFGEFIIALNQSTFTYTPALNSNTFEELLSTGYLGLITDESLISALFDYYRFDEGQRQFLGLQQMTEFKYFELSAGVLTNEQVVRIQDSIKVASPRDLQMINQLDFDKEQVLEAVGKLRNKPELVSWLPQVRVVQLDLIFINEERMKRAEGILGILNNKIN